VSPKIVVDRSCSRKNLVDAKWNARPLRQPRNPVEARLKFNVRQADTPPKPTPTEVLHQLQNVCTLEPCTLTPCSLPLWPEQWLVALHLPRCSGSTKSRTTLSRLQRQTYCNHRYVLLKFRQKLLYKLVDSNLLLKILVRSFVLQKVARDGICSTST
jgi:hypothetical protein